MPKHFDADDLSVFLDWVESFEIQSGMNDNEEFSGRFFSRLLASYDLDTTHHKLIQRQLDFLHRGLYTGYDGYVPKECTEKILTPLARDLIDLGWNRSLNQVKLKFGELRFYLDDRNENYEKRILNAMIEWNDKKS
ncbi:hypothetical protein EHQ92_16225 [Leptospira biflexa]|uniref:hypothetical protein n=1 Tax=Leptospira biflexa TaxID=172 RepID=UPI0010911DB4|nr:hypothetical protein [Leptospira biflexa]TGM42341.1 hypothetical protein EHQ92_16225 [Leptospira biflexa]TGM44227.1 hypothetical protein EHQ88_16560 [Leptospira biflexa]